MAKGYKIKDRQTAQTLVHAGRETPWKKRSQTTSMAEPVGIFMRTQLVELESAAAEPDEEGKITVTDAIKKRVDWDDANENPEPSLATTEDTTDVINIEQTPISSDSPVLMTTDVYNTRLLMGVQPSEVFGKLSGRWNGSPTAVIQLDEHFTILGKHEVEMKPAPTVTADELPDETPVTCRFIKSLGEWRFFPPTGDGTDSQTAVLTVSGSALGGFGTYDSKTIWATTLSAATRYLASYRTIAIVYDQTAIASESDLPWLRFPTTMPEEQGTLYVRGTYYRTDEGLDAQDRYRIYAKADYGEIYLNQYGNEFKDTFCRFNSLKCYSDGMGDWLYHDGFGKWMEGSILGLIHQEPPADDPTATGGVYGADTIQDLGFTAKAKPYWTCDDEYGIYEPKNGATGTFQFGLPTWEVTDNDGTQIFARSWKPVGIRWDYLGTVTIDSIEYKDIRWDNGKWILGTRGSELRGWYESSTEPDPDSDVDFEFKINIKTNKTATAAQILRGWEHANGEIVYEQTRQAYEIASTPVAWWALAAADISEISYTFDFHVPQDSTVTGEPKTVTLAEILNHTWNETNIIYDESSQQFRIGTLDDESGWWTCDESDLQTSLIFAYRATDRADLTFTFKEYIAGDFSEEIWYITPEVITRQNDID